MCPSSLFLPHLHTSLPPFSHLPSFPLCLCTRGWPEDSCAKPLAYIQVHNTHTDTAGCCSGFPGREQEPGTRREGDGERRAVEDMEGGVQHAEKEREGWRDDREGVRWRRVVVKSFFIRGFIFHCGVLPLSTSLYFSSSVLSSSHSPPLIPLCLSLSSPFPLFPVVLSLPLLFPPPLSFSLPLA